MLPFASANDDAADYFFAIDDDEPFPHIITYKNYSLFLLKILTPSTFAEHKIYETISPLSLFHLFPMRPLPSPPLPPCPPRSPLPPLFPMRPPPPPCSPLPPVPPSPLVQVSAQVGEILW